jgi:hypothetical protein
MDKNMVFLKKFDHQVFIRAPRWHTQNGVPPPVPIEEFTSRFWEEQLLETRAILAGALEELRLKTAALFKQGGESPLRGRVERKIRVRDNFEAIE